MSYQNITIVGNVGRDPEIKYLQNGDAVCDFTVAVSKVSGKGEARKETTTWFKISLWRSLAEIAGQYVKKGQKVLISGEVKASAYTTQTGEVRASLEITGNELRMLSRVDGGENAGGDSGMGGGNMNNSAPQSAPARGGGNRRPASGGEPTYTDPEDIPF